jgi:hypothetical protein
VTGHWERSEESRIANKLRAFTSLQMTAKSILKQEVDLLAVTIQQHIMICWRYFLAEN